MIVEIITIKTRGDRAQDVSISRIGGKGVFVKEIEEALLNGTIDIAVHSMKDVPVDIPEELVIGAITEREDPRDALISRENKKINNLPENARVGTSSLRRGSQLRNLLPHIQVVPLRGNLDTRIKKLGTEDLDGIIVASAGMKRMGWEKRISQYISVEMMMPSAGQGALGIEYREDNREIGAVVSFLNDHESSIEIMAEMVFLKELGGGCQLPIAAYGKKHGSELILRGLVGSPDGKIVIADKAIGSAENFEKLGVVLAGKILSRGGHEILGKINT